MQPWADPTIHYDQQAVARILADSGADLGDVCACIDVMVQHGVMPWNSTDEVMVDDALLARIEANNLRAMRHWRRKAIPAGLLNPIVLGARATQSGLASGSADLEHAPLATSDA